MALAGPPASATSDSNGTVRDTSGRTATSMTLMSGFGQTGHRADKAE
jgi:hypothetical protein